jgi:hypothetical protein
MDPDAAIEEVARRRIDFETVEAQGCGHDLRFEGWPQVEAYSSQAVPSTLTSPESACCAEW